MKYLIIAGIASLGLIFLLLRNGSFSNKSKEINFQNRMGNVSSPEKERFDEYWYSGLAELSGYELEQARYGELHQGRATMIFVTEPFSKKKQVKLDNPSQAGKDNISVLKLNSTRKFLTGIYPYSTMTSVFNPVSLNKHKSPLKMTMSGQEWCGQVYQQLNLDGNKFRVNSYSYFESEGDEKYYLDKSYLEDELFNIIRLNPELLPIGEIEIIPSVVVSRFKHEEFAPFKAEAILTNSIFKEIPLKEYQIKYKDTNRTLSIYFQNEFPYRIEGWTDTYSNFGSEVLVTKAVRKNTLRLDYWNKNKKGDLHLNEELYQD